MAIEKQVQIGKKRNIDIYRDFNNAIKVAGFKIDVKKANRIILLILGVIIFIAVNMGFVYYYFFKYYMLQYILLILYFVIIVGGMFGYLVLWVVFLIFLDYVRFRRKNEIERILPEFFRLVAANHRAGLSFEKALWKANQPRFGVLSEEIELVAKKTYTTSDLIGAMEDFSGRYDSKLLRRFVTILSEGLKAGSNMSELLDDIATNATRIMNTRKDMATDVMNYIFFILIAVMVVCPFMFGIGYQLMQNVHILKSNLELDSSSFTSSQFAFLQTKSNTDTGFYHSFAILMILSNCIISVLIISIVLHGNFFYDITKIPVVLIVSYAVYFATRYLTAVFLTLQ